MSRLAVAVATCGYIGYVRVAPGTFGSAVGLVVLWALRSSGSSTAEAMTIAVLLCVGIWSASLAERQFGRVDPGPVVIDEVVGMLVTLAFVPVNVTGAVLGFLVFRVLDIVKPWPASRLEDLPGGYGIMADDVMAAVYGNLLMRAAVAAAPAWLVS